MTNKEVEIKVKKVFESHTKPGVFGVILEEVDQPNRQIPIIIGEKEAHAVYSAINKVSNTRPLTQDIMISCFDFAKIDLLKAVIYKMDVGVYYSYIYLKKEDEFTRIDSRTSDALSLALRVKAPIYIIEEVLNKECIEEVIKEDTMLAFTDKIEKEAELKKNEVKNLQKKLEQAIDAEDYELASILRDRIAELD